MAGADILLDVVVEHLQHVGMRVKHSKCAFHVPALRRVAMEEWPSEAIGLAQRIAHRSDGLTLLGTTAAGELAVPLYEPLSLPGATQTRIDKALKLSDAILQMINLAPQAGARQAGFALARCVVAHSLDFDAGVLPCSLLLPHAGAIDRAVIAIAAASIDLRTTELSEQQRQQMCLPTRFAGLQLDLPSCVIPLARAARVVESGPAVCAAVAAWASPLGTPIPDPCRLDGVDGIVSDGIAELLRSEGIEGLGGGGKPVAAGQPVTIDPFRPATPERHLLSHYLRHAAETRYKGMLEAADASDRTRLLSASGPTAGSSFTSPLNNDGVSYSDRQWSLAIRWRLGIPHPGPPQACMNQSAARGEACEESIDADGDHAVECERGPLRNQRHDALADDYASIMEEIGAVARREVFVAEWSGQREAWLDVWAYGIAEVPDALLDITVRHPRAERYQPGAANAAGFAAAKAESEKDERYPCQSGRSVWPIAHETWGRLGSQAEALLQVCAAAAARRAYRRGRLPGNCLRRWRARLDATLHRSIAAQLSAARGGLPGRHCRRPAPVDKACLEARCRL